MASLTTSASWSSDNSAASKVSSSSYPLALVTVAETLVPSTEMTTAEQPAKGWLPLITLTMSPVFNEVYLSLTQLTIGAGGGVACETHLTPTLT